MLLKMPAEWESHDACWMAWPCRDDLWPDISKARGSFALVAEAISRFESVKMVCRTRDKENCLSLVGRFAEVICWDIDDSWTRDSGPIFVFDENKNPAIADFGFNGWGGKFLPFHNDALFVQQVAWHLGVPFHSSELVAEGGAIHVDGLGTALTTEQCLLNPNRNPGWTKEKVNDELKRLLGAEKVIWLKEGIVDDHTDGHIDEIACFVRPGHVLALSTDDKSDANYAILQNNIHQLKNEQDAQGQSLTVHTIEQPEARYLTDGTRMSLSYVNYYLANNAVIMAEFNQADYDRAAKKTLQTLFPNREIVQIPAVNIFEGGGGIHCITQQQPLF